MNVVKIGLACLGITFAVVPFAGAWATVCLPLGLGAMVYCASDFHRARWQRARARERRRRICEQREARLEEAGVWTFVHADLTNLVEAVTSPVNADYFRVDDLLDLYVDVAIAEHKFSQSARAPLQSCAAAGELQRAVRTRAAAWRDAQRERAEACGELKEDIEELIRLYVERAATPDVARLMDNDVLARPLALIDLDGPTSDICK